MNATITHNTAPTRAMSALSDSPWVRQPGQPPRNDIPTSTTDSRAWAAFGGRQPAPDVAYKAICGTLIP